MSTVNKSVVVALILVLLPISSPVAVQGAVPVPDQHIVSNYQEAQANPYLSDEAKIKNALDTYFKLRYEGQKLLQAQNFDFLVDKNQKWVQKEKDKREVELYNASLYKLNYRQYKYQLDYDSVQVDDRIATVQLRESHEVVFEALAPQASAMRGLEHSITLNKTRKGWTIARDEYKDELSQLMANETKNAVIGRIQRNHEAGLQQAAEFQAAANRDKPIVSDSIMASHPYDGAAAAAYADTWASNIQGEKRNPQWGNFDGMGGDCTNFASQAIYNGSGRRMDNTGNYQWYYFGYTNRSPAWTDVGKLYEYLIGNTENGPYGSNSSVCNMRPGDIIQLASASSWFHTLVVVSNYYPNQCWDYSYIWYDCHTTDRYHYPLSYVSGYQKRFIHVEGWRD